MSIPFFNVTCDNTGSMGDACTAARLAIPELVTITSLLSGSSKNAEFGVVGDFDCHTPDFHLGGVSFLSASSSRIEQDEWLSKYMKPCGGGGSPEAYRTWFNRILGRKPGLYFLFLDALPHGLHQSDGQFYPRLLDNQGRMEHTYIQNNDMIWDWDTLGTTLRNAGFTIVTFITLRHSPGAISNEVFADIYSKMGHVVFVPKTSPESLVEIMLQVLYSLYDVKTVKVEDQTGATKNYLCFTRDNGKIVQVDSFAPIAQLNVSQTVRKSDPDHLLEAFGRFLDASNPESVLTLTISPVLGKFWRHICGLLRYTEDGKYAERCQNLCDRLSVCSLKLSPEKRDVLKRWLDASHDETPYIRELVSKALQTENKTYLVLPKEFRGKLSLDDVLQIGRGGEFAEVGRLIASLNIVDTVSFPQDEDLPPNFLPLSGLKHNELFRLIGNLLSPGMLFSNNVAFFSAILALSNAYLKTQALEFLLDNRGKWIKWDLSSNGVDKELKFPVFWSLNFMRLLKLAPDDVLTPEEISFRDHYLLVAKLLRNHDASLEVILPLILPHLRNDVTWKRFCPGCDKYRCFTLFPATLSVPPSETSSVHLSRTESRCALCLVYDENSKYFQDIKRFEPDANSTMPRYIEEDRFKTHWAQCGTCQVNYGVSRPAKLNVRPKCHPCRFKEECETVECGTCLHKYLSPGGSAWVALEEEWARLKESGDSRASVLQNALDTRVWICPRCAVDAKSMIETKTLIAPELIQNNPFLKELIPFDYDIFINPSIKLWKRVLRLYPGGKIPENSPDKPLFYSGYKVHNPLSTVEAFKDMLYNHSGMEVCQMCISDVPVRQMRDACGWCNNRICEECVKAWYGQVKIGCVVFASNCMCPFCKIAPKHSLVKNLHLGVLRNVRTSKTLPKVEWRSDTGYAACESCLCVKPAFLRTCQPDATLDSVDNFVCEACLEKRRDIKMRRS